MPTSDKKIGQILFFLPGSLCWAVREFIAQVPTEILIPIVATDDIQKGLDLVHCESVPIIFFESKTWLPDDHPDRQINLVRTIRALTAGRCVIINWSRQLDIGSEADLYLNNHRDISFESLINLCCELDNTSTPIDLMTRLRHHSRTTRALRLVSV
ncbi:MAG: hypothetical protein HYV76_00310 [Candidatus Vogelbacteria bacterium]|nr:hypothetical protein [Candidatus Vogelbacteria bacterium]